MTRVARIALAVLLVLGALGGRPAGAEDVSTNPLFQRMERLNADVRSYTAELHVDVSMKSFPFLSPSLDGDVYFEQPDKVAIVFKTVPVLADQFKKVYPRIDPPSRWLDLYTVSIVGDQDGVTTFRLVPRAEGRVEHLDVRVDDKDATIVGMTWTYKDGGYVTLAQRYARVAGHLLVDRQTGRVALPAYQADVAAAFTDYKLNGPIDERVFGP